MLYIDISIEYILHYFLPTTKSNNPKHRKNCKCCLLSFLRSNFISLQNRSLRVFSFVPVIVFIFAIVLEMVISCLLTTLIKCLKGDKFLGLRFYIAILQAAEYFLFAWGGICLLPFWISHISLGLTNIACCKISVRFNKTKLFACFLLSWVPLWLCFVIKRYNKKMCDLVWLNLLWIIKESKIWFQNCVNQRGYIRKGHTYHWR